MTWNAMANSNHGRGGSLRMGWGPLRNITREIILRNLEKREKAMPMTICMFDPGFQLTSVRFPEEQAADRQWDTVAWRLPIPFCCISIPLYCQSNIIWEHYNIIETLEQETVKWHTKILRPPYNLSDTDNLKYYDYVSDMGLEKYCHLARHAM